jgi:hypothetical protein
VRGFALLGLGHAGGLRYCFGLRQANLRNIGTHRFATDTRMRRGCSVSVMVVMMMMVVLRESGIGSSDKDEGQHGGLLHVFSSPDATSSQCQQRGPIAAKRIRSPQLMEIYMARSFKGARERAMTHGRLTPSGGTLTGTSSWRGLDGKGHSRSAQVALVLTASANPASIQ